MMIRQDVEGSLFLGKTGKSAMGIGGPPTERYTISSIITKNNTKVLSFAENKSVQNFYPLQRMLQHQAEHVVKIPF